MTPQKLKISLCLLFAALLACFVRISSAQTTVAPFNTPQQQFLDNSGNNFGFQENFWNGLASAQFDLPLSLSSFLTVSGAETAQSINGNRWVGTGGYSTLAACYAALPAGGGTCWVVPNQASGTYTETFAANLVLSKNNAGFIFAAPATITMGNFQITKAGGVNGAFIKAVPPMSLNSGAVLFNYTGASDAMSFGDSATITAGFELSHITINTGSSAVSAVRLIRTAIFVLDTLNIIGSGNNTTIGIVLDGTGSTTANSVISNARILTVQKGMQFTGSGLNAGNANAVISPVMGFITTGGMCVDFEAQATGNVVTNLDCEGAPTGVNFGANSNNNRVSLWHSQNTTDVIFATNSQGNVVDLIGPWTAPPVITDNSSAGNNNSVLWTKNYKQDVNGNYTTSGTIISSGALSGGATNAGLQAISSNTPAVSWKLTSGGADAKWWDIIAPSNQLVFRAINDVISVANSFMTVTRSGATIQSVQFPVIGTLSNCSSSASPAVCGSAAAGSVAIANPATTIQVNTTAVTANSQIFVQEDSSLGTKLGVTCNATLGRTYQVTARTGGTSFTITASATPAANSACLSYSIIN